MILNFTIHVANAEDHMKLGTECVPVEPFGLISQILDDWLIHALRVHRTIPIGLLVVCLKSHCRITQLASPIMVLHDAELVVLLQKVILASSISTLRRNIKDLAIQTTNELFGEVHGCILPKKSLRVNQSSTKISLRVTVVPTQRERSTAISLK